MIPRLEIHFDRTERRWFKQGREYSMPKGEFWLNHCRSGIQLELQALELQPQTGVGMMVYNCHTVMNAIWQAGCKPVFVDITDSITIDMEDLARKREQMQVLIVTHLFGIVNDVKEIKRRYPDLIVIEDCAHCYEHEIDGEFGVYSVGQGKFPSIGDGGILVVKEENIKNTYKNIENNFLLEENKKEESELTDISSNNLDSKSAQKQAFGQPSAQSCSDTLTDSSEKNSQKISKNVIAAINEQYAQLRGYTKKQERKLYVRLWMKAMMYSKGLYWLTRMLKGKRGEKDVQEQVTMRKMSRGIANIMVHKRAEYPAAVQERLQRARQIENAMIGENAFMAIVRSEDPIALQNQYAERGIETETHFKHCISWAEQFGYVRGTCPKAETLVDHLLMIPTYCEVKRTSELSLRAGNELRALDTIQQNGRSNVGCHPTQRT